MNTVNLMGYLGADPELKFVGNDNRPTCALRLATNESWKDKNGQKQERVTWHRVVVWGAKAENCAKYLEKGRQVLVTGKISNRSYEVDGDTRWITEIVADNVQFLGGGKNATNSRQQNESQEDLPI